MRNGECAVNPWLILKILVGYSSFGRNLHHLRSFGRNLRHLRSFSRNLRHLRSFGRDLRHLHETSGSVLIVQKLVVVLQAVVVS